jgi:ribonuclease P protein component
MSKETKKLSFTKDERLCSKIIIDEIFEKGKKQKSFPFIATYLTFKSDNCDWKSQVRIVVSVPKRRVKLAAKRNRLKRQIKEAYRLNKSEFYTGLKIKDTNVALFLIYIGKEKENYSFIEKKIKLLLTDIQDNL